MVDISTQYVGGDEEGRGACNAPPLHNTVWKWNLQQVWTYLSVLNSVCKLLDLAQNASF